MRVKNLSNRDIAVNILLCTVMKSQCVMQSAISQYMFLMNSIKLKHRWYFLRNLGYRHTEDLNKNKINFKDDLPVNSYV